jgi:hypothetical protein
VQGRGTGYAVDRNLLLDDLDERVKAIAEEIEAR